MILEELPEEILHIIYKNIYNETLKDIRKFNLLNLKKTFISITPYYTLWEDAYCNRKSIYTTMEIPRTKEIYNKQKYEIIPYWNEPKKTFKIAYTISTYK